MLAKLLETLLGTLLLEIAKVSRISYSIIGHEVKLMGQPKV